MTRTSKLVVVAMVVMASLTSVGCGDRSANIGFRINKGANEDHGGVGSTNVVRLGSDTQGWEIEDDCAYQVVVDPKKDGDNVSITLNSRGFWSFIRGPESLVVKTTWREGTLRDGPLPVTTTPAPVDCSGWAGLAAAFTSPPAAPPVKEFVVGRWSAARGDLVEGRDVLVKYGMTAHLAAAWARRLSDDQIVLVEATPQRATFSNLTLKEVEEACDRKLLKELKK